MCLTGSLVTGRIHRGRVAKGWASKEEYNGQEAVGKLAGKKIYFRAKEDRMRGIPGDFLRHSESSSMAEAALRSSGLVIPGLMKS